MMWFLALASCLCLTSRVLAAPRGLTACPRHWEPEGEDANGCPSRCLNIATGEKIHLIVRYTLKGALLKGCVQCEERWIENTDCTLILCPESTSSCAQDLGLKPGNTPSFQLSSRGIPTEKPRHLSLELFKKLYPAEVQRQELPGGGVLRVFMPTHTPQIPRYTRIPQITTPSVQGTSTAAPQTSAEIVVVNDYPRRNKTTESNSQFAPEGTVVSPQQAANSTLTEVVSSDLTAAQTANQTSFEPIESTTPSVLEEVGGQGNVEEAADIPESTIPPPAPAPRVKSRYTNSQASTDQPR